MLLLIPSEYFLIYLANISFKLYDYFQFKMADIWIELDFYSQVII